MVARHTELAAQPLLLLMLALYDAAGNALQRDGETLDGADLYEQLLRSFADREMRKGREHLTEREIGLLVDHELERLAVAALAMFNRGAQSVTGEQLADDLEALLAEPASVPADRGAPSEAQRLVGRFFFVHVSESRYERPLRTYEFLHSTFGEYLVAWFTIRALPPWAAVVPFGRLRVRNDLLREPEVADLLKAIDPVTTRLGDELLPPAGGSGLAPGHGLLHVLFDPDASERSYRYAIEAARPINVGRRLWYGRLLVNQLLARPRPLAGDTVLTELLGLVRIDVTDLKLPDAMAVDLLRLIGRADGIAPGRLSELAAEVVGRTADPGATRRAVAEAARLDLRLAPIVDESGRQDG